MPTLIEKPSRITAAGNKPKLIDEIIGRVELEDGGGQHRTHAQPGRLDRIRPDAGVGVVMERFRQLLPRQQRRDD